MLRDGRVKHGLTSHPLRMVWKNMISRCYLPTNTSYVRYGGRGIAVCDEWRNDLVTFYEWAIENGWVKGLQIDRKDNDGDYCPKNCRFVTQKKSVMNRSISKRWYVFGEMYESCVEAGEALNVSSDAIIEWCDGYSKRGKLYPPKTGCWSEQKYPSNVKVNSGTTV